MKGCHDCPCLIQLLNCSTPCCMVLSDFHHPLPEILACLHTGTPLAMWPEQQVWRPPKQKKKNKVVNQWWVFLLPKKDSKSSEIGRCEDVNTSVELRWHQRLPFLIDFRLHCWCFRYPAANPLRLEIYFTIYDMFEPHPRSGYSIFPVLKPWNWQILPEISIWTGLQPSSCSLVPASHGLCGFIPKCVQKRRFPNPRYFQYYLH